MTAQAIEPGLSPLMRKMLRRLLRGPTVTVQTTMLSTPTETLFREGFDDSAALGLLETLGLAEWVGDPERGYDPTPAGVVRLTTHVARLKPGAEEVARRLLGYRH